MRWSALLVLVLAIGCGGPKNPSDYVEQIKPGYTKEQVEGIAGKPDSYSYQAEAPDGMNANVVCRKGEETCGLMWMDHSGTNQYKEVKLSDLKKPILDSYSYYVGQYSVVVLFDSQELVASVTPIKKD